MHEQKQELYKHSAAIQIENNITLLQRKAWNVLLWNAYDELPTKEVHCIPIPKLSQLIGYDSHDTGYLKEAAKAMMRCIVEYNVLGKDGKTKRWGALVLLAQADIEDGLLTYAYAPELRRRLHNPEMYARLDLNLQRQFESKYALSLWELCVDYLGSRRDCGETPFILLETFRKLMGIPADEYPRFNNFNLRVIKPAVKEINRVSDFRVSVDYQRQGRKVTALKFKIRRVVVLPEAVAGQRNLFPDLDDVPAVVKELEDAGLSSHEAWEIWHKGFDFIDEAARPADLHEDGEVAFVQYVREKIHLLKRRQASGKVEHSTGFLREALRHNYANPEYAQEQTRQAVAHEQEAKQERVRQAQTLVQHKAEIEHARDEALQALYLQLAHEAPDVLEQAVPLLLKENYLFRQFYQRDQAALANYHARALLQMGFYPYLAQYAPERVAALEQHYAAQLAAVEAQLAAPA
jgi:hypothetical protein